MEKTIESYFKLLNAFELNENNEQELKIYTHIFLITLEYLVNVAKVINFDKNERFYNLYKECEELFIINNTVITKSSSKTLKFLINEFFKMIGEKRINSQYKLAKFLVKGKDLIYQYFQQYRLDKNNDITKTALNSAINIVDKAKESFIDKSRTAYFNNDFIPLIRKKKEYLKEGMKFYTDFLTSTTSSIKENSDDWNFFMNGIFGLINYYMIDLIEMNDNNKLSITDVVGALYDIFIIIKSHLTNTKDELIKNL